VVILTFYRSGCTTVISKPIEPAIFCPEIAVYSAAVQQRAGAALSILPKDSELGTMMADYTLRHTAATLAASRGVPLREIGGFLGHTTERTTELYAKHSPDFLGRAAHALDELFGLQRADQCRPQPMEANTQTVDIIGVCAGAAEKNRTSDPTLTKIESSRAYHISVHFETHLFTLMHSEIIPVAADWLGCKLQSNAAEKKKLR
jgi:hypothetical protein